MFSLILMTPETDHPQEHAVLTELMNRFTVSVHVRKPLYSTHKYEKYLSEFYESHLSRIVIHEHHSLSASLPVKGIHLKEKDRQHAISSSCSIISTSVHTAEDLSLLSIPFEYVFFSPVYASISKQAYGTSRTGEELAALRTGLQKRSRIPVIALGGIDETTIAEVKRCGFDGGALLGAVWQNSDPVKAFEKIHTALQQ